MTLATSRPTSLHTLHQHNAADSAWWRHAVIYQIYPRSFADADGNGIGDLAGARAKLPYLQALGVDAVWFSPFYRSPQADAGYDVSDYRDIDPLFGTLTDFEGLLEDANALGLKVIVDVVPNHSSDEHPWFQEALAAAPGSPERARYLFRDGRGANGELPPNNWKSVFGGPGWTRITEADGSPGQWYLHLFDTKQPDFDWDNPQVRAEFHDVLRFWLDRGVAGFRVDVAHGLVKEPGLPDWSGPQELLAPDDQEPTAVAPMWDKDGVHEIYAGWRQVLNEYGDPERIMCAECWVHPPERAALYVRPSEFHQAFNFAFLESPWRATDLRKVIAESLQTCDSVGAPTTWVLSNHDVIRHATRLALPIGERRPNGIRASDPQPDAALGLRRARAASTLMLGLPGSAYVYQGEELGLPEATALPDEVREDPVFTRTGGVEVGRDGCRVPLPWAGDEPGLGFGPTGKTWLPQPESYAALAADRQLGQPDSTLELYRRLLSQRSERGLGLGSLAETDEFGPDVVAYLNSGTGQGAETLILLNLGEQAVALPAGAQVVVASGELTTDGAVPVDTAVWAQL